MSKSMPKAPLLYLIEFAAEMFHSNNCNIVLYVEKKEEGASLHLCESMSLEGLERTKKEVKDAISKLKSKLN